MPTISLLSMTTIESQMIGKPRSEFKFVRSNLDRFFGAISWVIVGVLFCIYILASLFLELPPFVSFSIFSVCIALFIWGLVVIGCPYEIVFDVSEKLLHIRFRILFIWKHTTYTLEEIEGFEIRKFLTRKGSNKGWEFWLKMKNQHEIYIAKTKQSLNADNWKNALTKRFRLIILI